MASSAGVPAGFHYETKYVVLSYLGFPLQERQREEPPTSGAAAGLMHPPVPPTLASEKLDKVKAKIEEELKQLEEEISAAFATTGFDMHTSPVFNPASPESAIEECLTQLSEKLSLEFREPLDDTLERLLSGDRTYEEFRKQVEDIALPTSDWNKVVVPLVLLQRLLLELTRRGERCLDSLTQLGVTYIEEVSADYIIQQGGWGALFNVDSEEEEGLIAEDSNDIYILTSDNSEQLSPHESLAISSSWQTASLPTSLGPESWQQVAMDPEELKSLDSNGGGEERSENNSSNSDIVHVEKEEIAAVIEEAAAAIGEAAAVVVDTLAHEEEAEDRAVPVAPSVLTSALKAALATAPVEERGSPPSPIIQPEPPKVDRSTKRGSEKVYPTPSVGGNEESQPTSEEKGEFPSPRPLPPPPPQAEEDESALLPEGNYILLYGGLAAVAAIFAVGVYMALRKT